MMAFTTPSGSHAPRYALILLLLVCTLIYLKGLFGGFLFDDFPNIVDEPTFQAISRHEGSLESAIQASRAGPLHRPISASSFALDAYVFGLEPLAFKLHNLALHLLNGFLLYALARRLIPRLLPSADEPARRHLALFATALWLLHPLHVGSVLYIVQRMNLLSTLFTLILVPVVFTLTLDFQHWLRGGLITTPSSVRTAADAPIPAAPPAVEIAS